MKFYNSEQFTLVQKSTRLQTEDADAHQRLIRKPEKRHQRFVAD